MTNISKTHILYAEDKAEFYQPMLAMLEDEGFTTDHFTAAHKAIAAWDANPGSYGLVILDHGLLMGTGVEVLLHIRKSGSKVKVIGNSASSSAWSNDLIDHQIKTGEVIYDSNFFDIIKTRDGNDNPYAIRRAIQHALR